MKRIFFINIILLMSLLSCNKLEDVLGINYDDGLTYADSGSESKTFKTISFSSYGTQLSGKYKFNKVQEYDKLIIYVKEGSGYKKESIDYIAKVFNDNYDEEVRIYGHHTDVDKNGKIIILLFEINSSYEGAVTTGYFYGADLILGYHNDAEILYMDIKIVNENPEYMAGTIQHEFQHLINFNVNYIENKREMSTWLNEALSESTSVLFSPYTVNSRINEFNVATSGYYCFYTWDLPLNVFANYPSASVFMNWLYKKNNNNSSVFQSIAADLSDNDYQRVFNNVAFTGASSWDDLLFKWLEGVKNKEVAGAELKIQNAGSSISLFPGALVAYSGTLTSTHANLVTKNLSGGINLALNKDTYVGNNPTSINIKIPASSSIQASKTYKMVNDDEPYIPKYRHVLFNKDGEIKKY
ncbi:peptidase M30 [Brachyspira pilosicoli]|uniref:peptidase M30 n=1 Tax=Brachyspira pilosicoli TaxID=52584 RepID=UPI003005C9CF